MAAAPNLIMAGNAPLPGDWRRPCFCRRINASWHAPSVRLIATWPDATGGYLADGLPGGWITEINPTLGVNNGGLPCQWFTTDPEPANAFCRLQLQPWATDPKQLELTVLWRHLPLIGNQIIAGMHQEVWDWAVNPHVIPKQQFNPAHGDPGDCYVWTIGWWKTVTDVFPNVNNP